MKTTKQYFWQRDFHIETSFQRGNELGPHRPILDDVAHKKFPLAQCNATNNKIVAFIAFNYVNVSLIHFVLC